MITAKELMGLFWLGIASLTFGVGWIVIGVDAFITQKFTPQLRLLQDRENITGTGAKLFGIHMILNGGVSAACGLLGITSILNSNLSGIPLINISVIGMFYALVMHLLVALFSSPKAKT